MLAVPVYVGATRFDRFGSLLSSVGTQFTCHRVPPWSISGIFRAAVHHATVFGNSALPRPALGYVGQSQA
eukprot:7669098-Alexandrium_andersonii.AAC.1